MKLFYTILIIGLSSIILASSRTFTNLIPFKFLENDFLNTLAKYQILALFTAIFVAFLVVKLNPESVKYLTFGDLNSIPEKEKWLGINGITNWKKNGIQLMFFVSIPTAIFMFLGVKYTNSLDNFQLYFIPLILLFSFTNSFAEEIIFRFGIIGGLDGNYSKLFILILSAILFGLPHYFGNPSGLTGVIMSGILGYILCKATIETKGISIAWAIHFIQDVIIFTTIIMMNAKK